MLGSWEVWSVEMVGRQKDGMVRRLDGPKVRRLEDGKLGRSEKRSMINPHPFSLTSLWLSYLLNFLPFSHLTYGFYSL